MGMGTGSNCGRGHRWTSVGPTGVGKAIRLFVERDVTFWRKNSSPFAVKRRYNDMVSQENISSQRQGEFILVT